MIKGILFALFFVLLFVAIGLIVLFSIKNYKEEEDYQRGLESITHDNYGYKKQYDPKDVEAYKKSFHRKYKGGLIGAVVASVAMLGLVIAIPGSFHQVDTGTVAVVRHLGKIVDVKQPGTHFDFYMVKKYETFDTKVQQDKITTLAYSNDGQTMELEVFLQYQVQSENIKEIATQYGTLEALQARIETQTVEKTKAVMSSAPAMEIIQKRAQFSNDVSEAVRTGISSDYYVNVKDVVLTNIDFTDEFEKSVEDKVVAEQQKQAAITKAEAEKQTAIIKAEQELETARIEAEKKIVEAQADAQQQIILAEAAAKAATAKIIELARALGFPITTEYVYANSETGLSEVYPTPIAETETVKFVETRYTITFDANHTKEDLDKLVISYLEYIAYLEQWNGVLPEVVAGDDAISIIIPNN